MPGPGKGEINKAARKALMSDVDIMTELKLTPEERKLFENADKAINAVRANPRLEALAEAWGVGCGGVTC